MSNGNGNGAALPGLIGWRKVIATFVSVIIIFAAAAIFEVMSEVGLNGDQFVSVVYANMYIVLGLMAGNGLSHLASALGKK